MTSNFLNQIFNKVKKIIYISFQNLHKNYIITLYDFYICFFKFILNITFNLNFYLTQLTTLYINIFDI